MANSPFVHLLPLNMEGREGLIKTEEKIIAKNFVLKTPRCINSGRE
jgi:hypothetical protein